MGHYNETLLEFDHATAQLLGISVAGVWFHAAFEAECKLDFPR
ncbi:hypothetical protein U2P60_02245 [Brucella sp. H1_1004]